jgi:hypothetical protein
MEFVITSGSARSADVTLGVSFGADRTVAALTTISISIQYPTFLFMMIFSKNETSRAGSGKGQGNILMHRFPRPYLITNASL